MIRPIVSSWFAEIVPTWAIIGPLTGFDIFLQLGGDRRDGLLDAALDGHRVGAGGDVLRAFAIDRLRQHRGRRRAVAGDVGRLARDFLHHLGAHVLERILQVDFLRDRDAVLGDRRRAELLVEDDVAPLGPERHLHRIRQAVDAAQNRLPRGIAVRNLVCHQTAPCVAAVDDREHFVFLHDQVLDAIELDLLAGVLAEQDGVARLDVERHPLAVLVALAAARREHLALLWLFLGGIGNDDRAACAARDSSRR